ncbi:MAG: AMP-binding protein [Marinobacter sp.]|uniref:class I adenylate-forming enzyme family protein n=1 Tax=Marinobacter sp. TaxID=50741 RepID=UPI0032985721
MSAKKKTIDAIFEQASNESGMRTHLVLTDGSEISYSETFERGRRLASALRQQGVKPGDRVASFMYNCRTLYEFYIGVALVGGIAVPINVQSTAHEVEKLFLDCTPKVVIANGEQALRLPNSLCEQHSVRRLITDGSVEGWADYEETVSGNPPLDASFSDPESAALIIYSSGTTGQPKGIVLRHRCLIDNAETVIKILGYRQSDRFITLLPSFHLYGYSFDFLYSALVHARMLVLPAFDPEIALDLIERERISVLTGVPTMFSRMFDTSMLEGRDLSSLRLIDVGGGPVSVSMKRRLKDELDIDTVESYGLSEITTVACVQLPGQAAAEGSCGPPLPGFDIRVMLPSGEEAPVGTPGELLFRSPTFMLGYWRQPELTDRTIRDGWLHTGDVGTVDEAGNVYILDRIKDMIVTNGLNVFPKEVENEINEHPAVASVAVIGVPHETRGEEVHAFVVQNPNIETSAESIIAFCEKRLARYKVPRSIFFLDEMPLTASGKIRRFMLRDMAKREKATT